MPRTKRCSASVSGKPSAREEGEADPAWPAISSASSSEIAAISVITATRDVAGAAAEEAERDDRARRRAPARTIDRDRLAIGDRQRRRPAAAARKTSGQRLSMRAERLLLGDVGQADQVAEQQHRADHERARQGRGDAERRGDVDQHPAKPHHQRARAGCPCGASCRGRWRRRARSRRAARQCRCRS